MPLDKSTLSNFLKSGAFVRPSRESCLIWTGPFCAADEASFSVSYLPFFSREIQFFNGSSPAIEVETSQLLKTLDSLVDSSEGLGRSDFDEPDSLKFSDSMTEIQNRISKHEISKAVGSAFARADRVPTLKDRALWLHNLLSLESTSIIPYGFWSESFGVMGATPEVLFHKKGEEVLTMALAGTCPRSDLSTRQSLLEDKKELAEHDFVVRDIADRLAHWGEVSQSPTEILELPSLLHLVTRFRVKVKDFDFSETVRSLHPTPALGVFPRSYGHQWLKGFSADTDKQFFGAPLAFKLGEKEILCLIAIRNIQWTDKETLIGSGAGIVSESQSSREWHELKAKRDSVFTSLGIQ